MSTYHFDNAAKAYALIKDYIHKTPVIELSPSLLVKCENLQKTHSFKTRGACLKLLKLKEQGAKKVIAASAGNHAQAVSYFAHLFGLEAVIVMPTNSPVTKIKACRDFGASVELYGYDLYESFQRAQKICEADPDQHFVHPYDDDDIIVGQSTAGLEIAAYLKELDYIMVPIGGGGLISGMALVIKELAPHIELYGVQTSYYPSMFLKMSRGEGAKAPAQSSEHNDYHEDKEGPPQKTNKVTLAEGIAVKSPGHKTSKIIQEHVKDIIIVDEEAIEHAVRTLAVKHKLVTEGAGAAGFAAYQQRADHLVNKKGMVVLSGGNIDTRVLSSILMRGLIAEGRLIQLRLEMLDSPGSLAMATQLISEAGGNVLEVYHNRLFRNVPVKYTQIDMSVELSDKEVANVIFDVLKQHQIDFELL